MLAEDSWIEVAQFAAYTANGRAAAAPVPTSASGTNRTNKIGLTISVHRGRLEVIGASSNRRV